MENAHQKPSMSRFYVACDLGPKQGRISLGQLNHDSLFVSEVHKFSIQPIDDAEGPQWDIPSLYADVLEGMRSVGAYDEQVSSISFSSWGADYMLFDSGGSLISPTFHRVGAGAGEGMRKVLSKVSPEALYEETGVQPAPADTLFQLALEKSKRISKASRLFPVADGFNYLLTGVPCVEVSMTSRTQLYNPSTSNWSSRLLGTLSLPPSLFPEVVHTGTPLGPLKPEIALQTRLEDTQVVASCSHELAAATAGLPVQNGECWGFMRSGDWTVMGLEIDNPIIGEESRQCRFTNEIGYGGMVNFHRHDPGLWLMKECQRYWEKLGQGLDAEMLMHLSGSAPAFESLIDPADPMFLSGGEEMPAKIQAYCRATDQPVPRKPGPIVRCILESLALSFRRTLEEMQQMSGHKVQRLYVMNGNASTLLNHFTSNALRLPVVVIPMDVTALGNVVTQALALGHIRSVSEAHDLARSAVKTQTIVPHGNWEIPYAKFLSLHRE